MNAPFLPNACCSPQDIPVHVRLALKSSLGTTRLLLFPRAAPAKRTIWHWFPVRAPREPLTYLPPPGASGTIHSIAPVAPILMAHRSNPARPVQTRHHAAANPDCAKPDQFRCSAPKATATTSPPRFARP